MAILENLLGIDNQTELAKAKEKVSKTRAMEWHHIGHEQSRKECH